VILSKKTIYYAPYNSCLEIAYVRRGIFLSKGSMMSVQSFRLGTPTGPSIRRVVCAMLTAVHLELSLGCSEQAAKNADMARLNAE
jgi:hypothetical protein